MRWDGYRDERVTYRRVTWPGLVEGEDVGCVTGGSLELSALSDLRSSGTAHYCSDEELDTDGLLRVYYTATDATGESETTALGTYFMTAGEPDFSGSTVEGELQLQSVLKVALKAKPGRIYTVAAGTNAVAKAVAIMGTLGLRTNEPSSSYTLSRDAVYDPDDCWLTIANDLLSRAGYASCWPDGYGVVQMDPYTEPQEREHRWDFASGELSILEPVVTVSDNSGDTYNACRLTYETEEESLWASAVNDDPNSESCRERTGYEVTYYEGVTELSGGTTAERLASLKAMAQTKLADNSSEVQYLEWGHPWVPLWPNDAIGVSYPEAGVEWSGAVTSMQISLDGHATCTTKARRFVRKGFTATVEGGSW